MIATTEQLTEQTTYTCNGETYRCQGEQHGGCLSCDALAPRTLRQLADWIELHGLHQREIIACNGSQWNEPRIQIYLSGARRIWPGRQLKFDGDGHAEVMEGNLKIIISDDRRVAAKEYEVVL